MICDFLLRIIGAIFLLLAKIRRVSCAIKKILINMNNSALKMYKLFEYDSSQFEFKFLSLESELFQISIVCLSNHIVNFRNSY